MENDYNILSDNLGWTELPHIVLTCHYGANIPTNCNNMTKNVPNSGEKSDFSE